MSSLMAAIVILIVGIGFAGLTLILSRASRLSSVGAALTISSIVLGIGITGAFFRGFRWPVSVVGALALVVGLGVILRAMAADITEKRGVVRALRKSERRLLESQRIARIGTIEHDLVTGEVVWTDEAFRLFGYEPGEVEPSFDAYLERLHPADLDKALQAKTALDGGEQMADAVRHVVWPDGSGHVLATVVNLEHDSSGNPIRLTRTIQDVTKLKERESEILRQEAFYKAVIEALDEAISVRDMDGHLLTSNGKRFWHKTQPSDLASLARLISVSDVIEEDGTPSIRLRHANELLECIEGGSRAAISRAEEVLKRHISIPEARRVQGYKMSDGHRVWLSTNTAPVILAGENEPIGNVRASTNITALKNREEELLEEQERLRNILENVPVVFLALADSGVPLFWNKECEKVTGYAAAEIVGNPKAWELLVPDTTDREQIFRERKPRVDYRDMEVRFRSKSGAEIVVAFTSISQSVPIPGWEVWAIGVDVTERIRADLELREAKETAELANRTKSEFLANMSHELRTPLNAISGFSQAMQSGIAGPLTDKQQEYLSDIQTSGDHLLALINDVLDLSKVELGELELSDESVDLADCIESSVRMFNERKHEARLEVEMSGLVGLPLIRGDSRKVRQILLNLLSNAFKFTERRDEIVVDAGVMANGAIYFQVSDTGIGMAPDEVGIALTMFGQVDSGMGRNFEGSGLGLPLCKSLIEAHDGTLEIESEPGIGTKVRVIFPPERVVSGTAAAIERLPLS